MRLLFDANLSPRLIAFLEDIFPSSSHCRQMSKKVPSDPEIWQYAKNNDFLIVSKDSDFHQLSLLHGAPPKVIWLRKGNCSTLAIAQILRDKLNSIEDFYADENRSFLILE